MSEYKGDKRTKEYKDWKKSKGLGDTVAKLTKVTGVKAIVHALFGDDCGCDERQEKLNKLFPYSNYLTEDEFLFLHELFSKHLNSITGWEKAKITTIYNRVFYNKKNVRISGCSKCYQKIVRELMVLHDSYIDDL